MHVRVTLGYIGAWEIYLMRLETCGGACIMLFFTGGATEGDKLRYRFNATSHSRVSHSGVQSVML